MSDSLNNLQNTWECIYRIHRKEKQNVLWPDLEKKVKVMRLSMLHHLQAKTTLEKRNRSLEAPSMCQRVEK